MGKSIDDRFPLSIYFRMADHMIKQATVHREGGNLGDLSLTLSRYIRLVSEVIPQHRDYLTHSSKEKLRHKKTLQEAIKELAKLRPLVGNETKGQPINSSGKGGEHIASASHKLDGKEQAFAIYSEGKVDHCNSGGSKDHSGVKGNKCNAASKIPVKERTSSVLSHDPFPKALTAAGDRLINVHIVRQHFPSSVLSFVERPPLVGHVSHITIPESGDVHLEASPHESSTSNVIQDVHISMRLMEEFMELARDNTDKDLETCGVLGASLKNRTFYVTTLVVPKQESSCNSCQALNEEDIYETLDQRSLFPVGWIHTHPSQSCFLSSIDLHTQYSYQVMLPEAIAIVMAPTDPTRSYGIFRLSDPGGIAVLKECPERGFHPHPETADGSPIYESCSNVYINPNLRFEIIDLRGPSL